jgi:hypothetical protein
VKYFRGIPQGNIISNTYPKTQACLRIVSLAVSALSFAGPLQVSRDYFSGDFGIFMEVTSIIATIFLSATAMFTLVDDILTIGVRVYGSQEHEELIKLNSEIQRLIELIRVSPMIDFINFCNVLPEEKYEKWLRKLEITKEQIENYLESIGDNQSLLAPTEAEEL